MNEQKACASMPIIQIPTGVTLNHLICVGKQCGVRSDALIDMHLYRSDIAYCWPWLDVAQYVKSTIKICLCIHNTSYTYIMCAD